LPKDILKASIKETRKFAPNKRPNIYWLSWFDLYSVIDKHIALCERRETLILRDLKSLLIRKRLVRFADYNLESIGPVNRRVFYIKKFRYVVEDEPLMRNPIFYKKGRNK